MNPAATGGAGPDFEARVAALCLAQLLAQGCPICLGNSVLTTVHLQAAHLDHGWHTDDILLEAHDGNGQVRKAALQVKRSFTISESNTECIDTIRGAFNDFNNADQFDKDRDQLVVVVSSLSARLSRGIQSLLNCARASTAPDDFLRRLEIPKYIGKVPGQYYSVIVSILKTEGGMEPTNAMAWKFLRCLNVVDIDIAQIGGVSEVLIKALLAATNRDQNPDTAESTWNELVTLASNSSGNASSFTRELLPKSLLEKHDQLSGFGRGLNRLLEDTLVVTESIKTTVAGHFEIPRTELSRGLIDQLQSHRIVFVIGAAGAGKSAIAKQVFESLDGGRLNIAYRATSLAGNHINEVLATRGTSLKDLQIQTGNYQSKLIWIDSVERLMEKPPELRAAFHDLLRSVRDDPSWRFIITCRDYSAETVRTALLSNIEIDIATLEVGSLSDQELDAVASDHSTLSRPLSSTQLRKLLCNPFYLDMASKMDWPQAQPLPETEKSFRDKLWTEVVRRDDEGFDIGLPSLRDSAIQAIALARAKALNPFVAVESANTQALQRLVRDNVLAVSSGSPDQYAPSHDVFEDWALMRWLDGEFERNERMLDRLVASIGTYPALRRAYRHWLTEALDSRDVFDDERLLEFVSAEGVSSHWQEDTLVGVLQSSVATDFLMRNCVRIIGNDGELLRKIIHLLRVACQAQVPASLFGLDSSNEIYLPRGNGWVGAANLLYAANSLLREDEYQLVIGFAEDFLLLTKYGIPYPNGSSSVCQIAWHWIDKISWSCTLRDAKERLFKVLIALPLKAQPSLTTRIDEKINDSSYSDSKLLKLGFNHFYCDALVRDLPDCAFRIAEHLLGLQVSVDEVVRGNIESYSHRNVESAFGFGYSTDDYPASAFQGPYLRMLSHHPDRAVELIVRLVNRACDVYGHTQNRHEYIEQPGKVALTLPSAQVEQYANWRLWAAYRGKHVTPNQLESPLMALEHWLLAECEGDNANDIEALLLSLLTESNNVAISAVVASVASAYPFLAGEAAFALLTSPALIRLDIQRSTSESFSSQVGAGHWASAEQRIQHQERAESDKLKHRGWSLQHVAIMLQRDSRFNVRVIELIDSYRNQVEAIQDQTDDDKLWLIQLHRMDSRNFVVTGKAEDGKVYLEPEIPDQSLQQHVQSSQESSAIFNQVIAIFQWAKNTFDNGDASGDWEGHVSTLQSVLGDSSNDHLVLEWGFRSAAYAAAVGIRDRWDTMSVTLRNWCIEIVRDGIESDADTDDRLSIVAHHEWEVSRPSGYIISALLERDGTEAYRKTLLECLSKAAIHSVDEVVKHTVVGVARHLFGSNRSLAITCMTAIARRVIMRHEFLEHQRSLDYTNRESWETEEPNCIASLRRMIYNEDQGDEELIASTVITRWPGRGFAEHMFNLSRERPMDPLSKQIMGHCVAELPNIWKLKDDRNMRDEQESERHIDMEFDIVNHVCRYAIQLPPDDALDFLSPLIDVVSEYPEGVSEIVKYMVFSQGDEGPAQTFWCVWQKIADDWSNVVRGELSSFGSIGGNALGRELFLGVNWNEMKDWPPLHGESDRLRNLFLSLPPSREVMKCYCYYLAHAGTPTLPDALLGIAAKHEELADDNPFCDTAVFYLEEILARAVNGGDNTVRVRSDLRNATLRILDALVEAGSSRAFKLRDDFVTPIPHA